jgi:hypothetical protein
VPFDDHTDDCEQPLDTRWPLDPEALYPRERRVWFEQLWDDVVMLHRRYRLPVRSAWWENPLHIEALAATAAWVDRYDTGEWDDPPGKLALLFELERVAQLLRGGDGDPFDPDRDRNAFEAHLSLRVRRAQGRGPAPR